MRTSSTNSAHVFLSGSCDTSHKQEISLYSCSQTFNLGFVFDWFAWRQNIHIRNGTETYKYADSLEVKVSDCECFQYQKKYKAKSYTSTDVLIQKILSDSLYMKKLNLHFNIKESFEIGDRETSREGEMKYNHLKLKKIKKHVVRWGYLLKSFLWNLNT